MFTEPDVAVIVALPSATAVTSPADDTVAIDELDVAHVTVAPGIVVPPASFTVATKDAVSSMDVNDRLVGASVTEAAACDTVSAAVWFTEPDVAVIVALPLATAVTRPADDTVAIDELDVAHVTVAPDIVVPPASFTVGTSVVVSPNDANDRLVGASVTEAAACDTVTAAVWFTEPDVAVIVALPLATAVTRPADDTVATDALDVAHVTVAPLIVLSFASFTVATKDAASLMDAKLRLVGASVTLDAT